MTVQPAREQASWLDKWQERNASRLEDMKRGLYRFRRSSLSMLGLGIVISIFLMAILGPYFVPYPADGTGAVHIAIRLQPPSREHLFGTDALGRDVFTRVVLGTPISLRVGVIVLVVAITIGVPLGAAAGYFGGRVNETIMRITDIFLTVPYLILALAIAAALGHGITHAMMAISLVWWPGYCRLTAGLFLSLREADHVEAARSIGASSWRIIFRHILPMCISPIIIKASMDMGLAILATAALGFIGVGAQPPLPEWGAMISTGRKYLPTWWWYATFPGLAIFFTVLGFNLLGDGLRDVLDPRTRR